MVAAMPLTLRQRRPGLILFLSGLNLILLQFLVMHEFTSLIMGSELVILFVLVAYFLGYSIGYFLSDRVSDRFIVGFSLVTLATHMTFPFGPRAAFTWLAVTVSPAAALGGILGFGFALVAGYYSLFLPKFIRVQGAASLARLYGLELAGAITGIALVGLLIQRPPGLLAAAYIGILAAIVLLVIGRDRWAPAAAVAAAAFYSIALAPLNAWSTEYYFRQFRGQPDARVIETVYSPYTKIDVVQSDGRPQLYLNGNLNYGSWALQHFNFFLAALPARLRPDGDVLILGSGSLSSVAWVAPRARSVTTVELDAEMARVGQTHFKELNRVAETRNWRLVIDDGKHFLSNSPDQYDVIIVDIPTPAYIQTALLHTREFYALARAHLRPGGVLSVALSDYFSPEGQTSRRVLAGIAAVFPQYYVVNSMRLAGRSFALAGDRLEFDRDRIAAEIRAYDDRDSLTVLTPEEAEPVIGDAAPLSAHDLGLVLKLSWWRLRAVYFR